MNGGFFSRIEYCPSTPARQELQTARASRGLLRVKGPAMRLDSQIIILSGSSIRLAVLGFNAMGDAIRDILDPRMLSRVRGGRAG